VRGLILDHKIDWQMIYNTTEALFVEAGAPMAIAEDADFDGIPRTMIGKG
jgi:hypothetical protein